MADLEYNLNFNFRFNASGRANLGQGVELTNPRHITFHTFNYIINDIAFYAARKQQAEVRQNLEEKFAGIVRKELLEMGRKISKQAIGLGPSQRSPVGRLELEGPLSYTFNTLGLSKNMNLHAYTGAWAERNKGYLARKRRKYGHTRWFVNTNMLRRRLRDAHLYTSSFGPVRVKWDSKEIPAGSQAVRRVANLNVTRGRPAGRISVGELQISVLGRITNQMLADPDGRSYDSKFTGLFDMLPDEVAVKLGGPPDHRPIIEPFLSFYLTRQIPNKVFHTLEQSTRDRLTGQTAQQAFTRRAI